MEPGAIVALVIIAALVIVVVLAVISRLLLIAQPNEVVILSGRKRVLPTGEIVGYRIIRGGRALRIPFIEKASRMSLETIPIELSVRNAYSKGGIPLVVEAIANVKIDGTEPALGNAVERFLTRKPEGIHAIAKDNLEGNLRGVLAALTPEEVNEDRLKFAQNLMEEADTDLEKLGLKLDTLKITNISDERNYLDSIGRMKTAEVVAQAKKVEADKKAEAEEAEATALKRAEVAKTRTEQEIKSSEIEKNRIITINQAQAQQQVEVENTSLRIKTAEVVALAKKAESEKKAEAEEAEANAIKRAEVAKTLSQQTIKTTEIEKNRIVSIAQAQAQQQVEIEITNLRIRKAELEKEAIIKEKEAEIAGLKAKAILEQGVEEERIKLQQKRLIADVIEPARAKREAAELEARGNSAKITANGEAQIAVLKMLAETYKAAGNDAEKVFALSLIPKFTEQLASTIKGINIDKITIVDNGSGDGSGFNKLVNQIPGSVISLAEMIENATGADVLSIFKKKSAHDKEAEEDVTTDFVNEEGKLKE